MKKYKLFIAVPVLFILILCVFYYSTFNKKSDIIVPDELSNIEIPTQLAPVAKEEIKPLAKIAPQEKNISVSLEVLDKKYEINTKEGSSVFEAMGELERNNNTFKFLYTKHASLGAFVTEINGVKGVPNKYWIYYVNSKKATVGISNYILKEGDIISWKQE